MNKIIITALAIGLAVPTYLLAGAGLGGPGMLQRFDTDNDGKVTQEEIDKVKSELFNKYDKDGNGVLSLDEWQTLRQDRQKERISQRFNHHDENGDGAISQEEFMAQSKYMMERMDRNGNHMIDQDEMGRHHGNGYGGHHGRHFGQHSGNYGNCVKS